MTRQSSPFRRHPKPTAKAVLAVFNVTIPARQQPDAAPAFQGRRRIAKGFGAELDRYEAAARAIKTRGGVQ
jgi:hypothetical protein